MWNDNNKKIFADREFMLEAIKIWRAALPDDDDIPSALPDDDDIPF